jgi:predicted nucleic-acid-binding Zn-ribbon protein
MNAKEALTCKKCSAKMFVDRVFLTVDHLELYCLKCGRREMYHNPSNFDERIQWIMKVEKTRAKRSGNPL